MSTERTQSQVVRDDHNARRTGKVPGRNIILLSDGTGNSAAKLQKTNVWRLYQALDLTDGTQIALYDDGVGTSGFKPLTIAGGVLGVGLARNVRELYEFACRHYRPPSETHEGDRLFIFGFSRGAFTARTVADFIATMGLLDRGKALRRSGAVASREEAMNTNEGLRLGVTQAYKSYRRNFTPPFLARMAHCVEDAFSDPVPSAAFFREQYCHQSTPCIEAVGVWDTVAAYGLPIDELSTFFDKYVFRHRYGERDLHTDVRHGYHAVAIDDERHTFHPVLWDESKTSDPERIEQVWFPGMHSDVGGGYPNGDLSALSLHWMMQRVSGSHGLRFLDNERRDIEKRVTNTAPMHNSRAGTGVYYRYNPRLVSRFYVSDDEQRPPAKPKLHERVLTRIGENTEGYAPAGLPTDYDIIDKEGRLKPATLFESDAQRERRAGLQERALDHIFWRRVNYFLMVFATIALLVLPHFRPATPGLKLSGLQSLVGAGFERLDFLLPPFLERWTAAWTQSPTWFLILLALVVGLLRYSYSVQAKIDGLAQAGWQHVRRLDATSWQPKPPGIFERWAKRIRYYEPAGVAYDYLTQKLFPWTAVLGVLGILFTVAYRLTFHDAAIGEGICSRQETTYEANAKFGQLLSFDTSLPCVDTGLDLVRGRTYTIKVGQPDGVELRNDAPRLTDGKFKATNDGYDSGLTRLYPQILAALPLRRHFSIPWHVLVGEIGRDTGNVLPLRNYETTFEAQWSGRLYLYVNDAINGLGLSKTAPPTGTPQTSGPRAKSCPTDKKGVERTSNAWCAYYVDNAGSVGVRVMNSPG